MSNCVFCAIVKRSRREEIVYENALVLAFPDKHPVTKGHTLVIPKQHFENIFEISEESLWGVIRASRLLAEKLRKDFGATGINLMHASGKDAEQSVPHLHFHVVPRYPNDGLDMWFHSRERK